MFIMWSIQYKLLLYVHQEACLQHMPLEKSLSDMYVKIVIEWKY